MISIALPRRTERALASLSISALRAPGERPGSDAPSTTSCRIAYICTAATAAAATTAATATATAATAAAATAAATACTHGDYRRRRRLPSAFAGAGGRADAGTHGYCRNQISRAPI